MKRSRSHSRRHWRLRQPKAMIGPYGIIWRTGRVPATPSFRALLSRLGFVTSTIDGVEFTHTFTATRSSYRVDRVDLAGGRDHTTVTIINNGVDPNG